MREEDFPDLEGITYLDSACMSLRPEQVIGSINDYYSNYPACEGRSDHSLARKATGKMEEARENIAELVGASSEDMILTSGTTEGLNRVARGTDFEKVVLTDREHNSNLVPWQEQDIEKVFLSTEDGLDTERLAEVVEEDTIVSMVHVSNLDGFEIPAAEVADITHEKGGMFMLDAAQSIPHRPVSVGDIQPDFMAFSGHKMLGPSGTGALYVSDRGKEMLEKTVTGGGAVNYSRRNSADFRDFPHGHEAGLPNIAGFIGMGEAAGYLMDIGMETVESHEKELTEMLLERLHDIDSVRARGSNGVISFSVEGLDPGKTSVMLDQRDIAVRSGMHCVHSWFDRYDRDPEVRASLHLYNTRDDVKELVDAVRKIALLS